MIDTTGAVRLDRVMLPTGTITREATAAHGIDRDELQRLHAPHYYAVHAEIEATLAAADVVLAYDAPLERRRLYRTAAGHELELPEVGWECVQVIYAEYSGKRAGNGEGRQRWTLRQAAGREGIPIGKPHLRALGDCRTMLRLLQAITGSRRPRRPLTPRRELSGIRCGSRVGSRGGRSPRRHRTPAPECRPRDRRGRRRGWWRVAPGCWHRG